ncbi:MAG: hypothetical protein IKI21_10820 [Oscillospiraceae bacterium]|nr:hypothetical protein [Oscillospiraceae bacterium]
MILLIIVGIIVGIWGASILLPRIVQASSDASSRHRQQRAAEAQNIHHEKVKSQYEDERRRILATAEQLLPKYRTSPLTAALADQITASANKCSIKYFHSITYSDHGRSLRVSGGAEQTMYIGNLTCLEDTTSIDQLGYALPGNVEERLYHAIALVAAVAEQIGMERGEWEYIYDTWDSIVGVTFYSKYLQTAKDLKSPV